MAAAAFDSKDETLVDHVAFIAIEDKIYLVIS